MFALLRKYSIRLQLLTIGIIILILLSVTGLWGYRQIQNITYKRNSDYTTEMIATIKQNVVSNADSINRILPNIAYNETIQEYLVEEDRLKQYELFNRLEKLLVNLKSMKMGILGIVLVGEEGSTSTYGCVGCRSYIPFEEIPERTSAYYSGIQYSPYYKEYVVYVGVPVYDNRKDTGGERKIGYAVMVLDSSAIVPRTESLSKNKAGSFYVLDRNQAILSGSDSAEIGKWLPYNVGKKSRLSQESLSFSQNGEQYVMHTEPLDEIEGEIVSVYPVKELFRGLEEVQRLLFGMFLLLIVVMYAFYIAISRNILQPLRSFMTFVYDLRAKGLHHLHKRVALEGYAEMSIMARQFNSLLDEIDDLTGELVDSKTHIYELQLLRKQAELQYMKSQINPHFLYNTLETIKGIAYVKGVPEIRRMTDALSRIFRYSVKGEEEVSVEEELSIVQAYISIQQIRFAERFEVRYEWAPECKPYRMLKMILQPLVENAVFHGIEPSLHKCTLTVGCRVEDERDLLLWVEDDGAGMEPETLEAIRSSLAEPGAPLSANVPAPAPGRHIGMLNVNNRIKYTYGLDYGLVAIESAPDRGTSVTIRIPAKGDNHV